MSSCLTHDQTDVLPFVAPSGGVTVDVPVLIGGALIVPLATAAAGAKFAGQVRGRAYMPKTSAQAWAQGDAIYWTGSTTTNAQTGDLPCIGQAGQAAANPSSYGYIDLGVGIEADSDIGNLMADLASTAASKGASMVGVRDADSLYDGATAEACLAEVKRASDRASVLHVLGTVDDEASLPEEPSVDDAYMAQDDGTVYVCTAEAGDDPAVWKALTPETDVVRFWFDPESRAYQWTADGWAPVPIVSTYGTPASVVFFFDGGTFAVDDNWQYGATEFVAKATPSAAHQFAQAGTLDEQLEALAAVISDPEDNSLPIAAQAQAGGFLIVYSADPETKEIASGQPESTTVVDASVTAPLTFSADRSLFGAHGNADTVSICHGSIEVDAAFAAAMAAQGARVFVPFGLEDDVMTIRSIYVSRAGAPVWTTDTCVVDGPCLKFAQDGAVNIAEGDIIYYTVAV